MKKIIQPSYFLSLLLLFVFACSSEDNNPIEVTGGEVFRSQIVTIALPNVTLSEDEYEATFDGATVTLSKSEEDKLLFLVPSSATLGVQTLVIPGLNNATINYDVKETILSTTPDETIAPFMANLNSFSQGLDATPEAVAVQNSLNSFTTIYANATVEKKTQMAILYKANKTLFDSIILEDFSSVTGRDIAPTDVVVLGKHSYAVYVAVAGAFVALYAPEPLEKVFGVALATVAAYKARNFFIQLMIKKFNKVDLVFNGIVGTNNKNTAATLVNELEFQSDVATTISFKANERIFISEDANKTQSSVVSFFKDYNKYNYVFSKVNIVIEWLNNNVPFANFSLIPLEVLPDSAPLVASDMTSYSFGNVTFTIDHPNLQLASASLPSDGLLNMKVTIIGTPSTLPIVTTLNYSYADGFCSFSGSIPIKVSNMPSINGTWHLTSVTANGTEILESCAANDLVTFNASNNTFSLIAHSAINNDCIPETVYGTYTINNSNLTYIFNEGPVHTYSNLVITSTTLQYDYVDSSIVSRYTYIKQ